jgi:anaerobic C4-dicarboxylate transporter
MDERFIFPQRLKTISFALFGIGLVGIIAAFFMSHGEEETKRWWANLLLNAVFFHSVAMACAFFQAATYVAYGGWQTVLRRVPEAISMFLPFTSLLLLIVLVTGHSYFIRMDAC